MPDIPEVAHRGGYKENPPHRYCAELAQAIEQKWQAYWDDNATFEAPNPVGNLANPDRFDDLGDSLFVLDMFPYPSGSGLHVGHPLGYIGTDTYSRYQRMSGRNVLYTMGFDAFGLPAEQFAVQTGQHPAITTEQNIATYRRQLFRLGLSHDKRRSISTADPDYYRWTQWIFKTIFEAWYDRDAGKARPIPELIEEFESGVRKPPHGAVWADLDSAARSQLIHSYRLAYIADAPVNWCPGLGTVVANEEVTAEGRSDRGNFPVFKRNMRQWMMRITEYADRLVDDLDRLDWSDAVKTMQRNWIGRSAGAAVTFDSPAGSIDVFTTRPDTLFGATFLVLAPEHPLVDELVTADRFDLVSRYRADAAAKKDHDRQDDSREKTGVPTGSFATNPVNGAEMPIWIADYVLMGYGTGAIMAVPCGDQRDFEFALKFGLEISPIQRPPDAWFSANGIEPTLDTSLWPQAFIGNAPYIGSCNETLDLNGLTDVPDAVPKVCAWLGEHGHGHSTTSYKLRDWLFSRQRYWGEPFPIVYDSKGTPHSLPEELLPVLLPETDSFAPKTFDPDDAESEPQSPLGRLADWVEVELNLGDGLKTYRRDTNVMPQWAGSCWYELRYLDPLNSNAFVDPAVEQYWMGPRADLRSDHPGGVDLYVGGVEHAVLHLLYARFWHKVLYDLGHVSSEEPYSRLFNQGYILAEAFKDDRGLYVEAAEVVKTEDGPTHDGKPVQSEWGKMGKSLKNGVSPDDMYAAFGADTLRLHEMSMGPLDASRPWDTSDVIGMYRFIQRLWRVIVDEETGEIVVNDTLPDLTTEKLLHRTIDAVQNDMSDLRFNTAIAKLIELVNHVTKQKVQSRAVAEKMVLMIAPLAPHLAEELWSRMGHTRSLAYEPFPAADAQMLVDEVIEYPVQVNGKVRSRISVPVDTDEAGVLRVAMENPDVVKYLDGMEPSRVVFVQGRLVNIVVPK